MGHLEQFYDVSKNSCTKVYTKIFLASRNHSICLPKSQICELKILLCFYEVSGAVLRCLEKFMY